ncbi:hypothetical protein ACLKA6_001309 [Drosophila palustris]
MSGPSRTSQMRPPPKKKQKITEHPEQNGVDRLFSSTGNSSVSAIHKKLDNLNMRLIALESNVASILTVVNQLAQCPQSLNHVQFPLKDLTSLAEMDAKIEENSDKYIDFIRRLMPDGIVKDLSRVLSESLIMDMNYSGTFSKKGLNSFQSVNTALYEATKKEGYTMEDYEKDVRVAFNKSKNRVYKKKSNEKKQNKQEQEQPEIEQVFIKEGSVDSTASEIISDEVQKKKKKKRVISFSQLKMESC